MPVGRLVGAVQRAQGKIGRSALAYSPLVAEDFKGLRKSSRSGIDERYATQLSRFWQELGEQLKPRKAAKGRGAEAVRSSAGPLAVKDAARGPRHHEQRPARGEPRGHHSRRSRSRSRRRSPSRRRSRSRRRQREPSEDRNWARRRGRSRRDTGRSPSHSSSHSPSRSHRRRNKSSAVSPLQWQQQLWAHYWSGMQSQMAAAAYMAQSLPSPTLDLSADGPPWALPEETEEPSKGRDSPSRPALSGDLEDYRSRRSMAHKKSRQETKAQEGNGLACNHCGSTDHFAKFCKRRVVA